MQTFFWSLPAISAKIQHRYGRNFDRGGRNQDRRSIEPITQMIIVLLVMIWLAILAPGFVRFIFCVAFLAMMMAIGSLAHAEQCWQAGENPDALLTGTIVQSQTLACIMHCRLADVAHTADFA